MSHSSWPQLVAAKAAVLVSLITIAIIVLMLPVLMAGNTSVEQPVPGVAFAQVPGEPTSTSRPSPTATPTRTPTPTDIPVVTPSSPCTGCIIYGVDQTSGPGEGIWQIDLCNTRVDFVLPLAGAAEVAAAGPNTLRVIDNVNGIWEWTIGTLAPVQIGNAVGQVTSATDIDITDLLYNNGADLRNLAGDLVGFGQDPYQGDLCFLCQLNGTVTLQDNNTGFVRVRRSDGDQTVLSTTANQIVGLGYDSTGTLWGGGGAGAVQTIDPTTGGFGSVLFNWTAPPDIADFASAPCNECEILPDLGDAPDSSNHDAISMTAYSGIPATFPTVFDPQTGLPPGPKHHRPEEDSWLGEVVTGESEADETPDEDGQTNIDPSQDSADRDDGDDGVDFPLALPICATTQFTYTLTVAGEAQDRYVNVWFDFNRDGDWKDTLTCTDGQQQQHDVYEWAIQDEESSLDDGSYEILTASFWSGDLDPQQPLWMRIALGDVPAASDGVNLPDGRGPSHGYEWGETEDYLLEHQQGEWYTGQEGGGSFALWRDSNAEVQLLTCQLELRSPHFLACFF